MILRVVAAAALATAVVYVFTPLTAAGQEGSPTGFFTNTRYLIPGLVLAMVLLPIARPLRAPDGRAWKTLLFLPGVYAITVLTTPRWFTEYIVGTVFLTLRWSGRRPRSASGARADRSPAPSSPRRAAVLVLLAVVLGRAQEVQYAEQHYMNPMPFLGEGGPRKAYDFARKQQDKRIGIIGSSEIIFGQYGFYGADLSNRVQYIGVKGPNGTNRLATSCRQFRRLINAGDYDYLIMSQYTQDSPEADYRIPIYAWVKDDPALKLVIEEPEIFPSPTTSSRSTASWTRQAAPTLAT